MNLANLLGEIRNSTVALGCDAWSELGDLADIALPNPMDPAALLPIATGAACGAQIEDLVPLSAALVMMALALRTFDDCADQDNPQALYHSIGLGQAENAAAGFSTTAMRAFFQLPLPPEGRDLLMNGCFEALLRVQQGQYHDIKGVADNLVAYEAVVERKTVAAFAFAATAGAQMATLDSAAIDSSHACGTHLGWMVQILDDIEALWFPDSLSTLRDDRRTYPVLYGLTLDHPQAEELRDLCSDETGDRQSICTLLDTMQVRQHLIALALNHRDQAIAALESPLNPDGVTILQLWMDWLFRDARRLLGLEHS